VGGLLEQEVPKAGDNNDVLLGGEDDSLHVAFHDHVARRCGEHAARSDESSCDNDDAHSDINLDVIGSDIAP